MVFHLFDTTNFYFLKYEFFFRKLLPGIGFAIGSLDSL